MIIFNAIRFRNFLSYGNQWTEIVLDDDKTTLILGQNGSGKCLDGTTSIEVKIDKAQTKNKFDAFMKERRK